MNSLGKSQKAETVDGQIFNLPSVNKLNLVISSSSENPGSTKSSFDSSQFLLTKQDHDIKHFISICFTVLSSVFDPMREKVLINQTIVDESSELVCEFNKDFTLLTEEVEGFMQNMQLPKHRTNVLIQLLTRVNSIAEKIISIKNWPQISSSKLEFTDSQIADIDSASLQLNLTMKTISILLNKVFVVLLNPYFIIRSCFPIVALSKWKYMEQEESQASAAAVALPVAAVSPISSRNSSRLNGLVDQSLSGEFTEYPAHPPIADGLARVVNNILSNAAKYGSWEILLNAVYERPTNKRDAILTQNHKTSADCSNIKGLSVFIDQRSCASQDVFAIDSTPIDHLSQAQDLSAVDHMMLMQIESFSFKTCDPAHGYIFIEISDTGSGIVPNANSKTHEQITLEAWKILTTPGVQSKGNEMFGLGIGGSNLLDILSQVKGKMEISTRGAGFEGTRIRIRIPCEKKSSTTPRHMTLGCTEKETLANMTKALKERGVLICFIDDSPINRRIGRRKLTDAIGEDGIQEPSNVTIFEGLNSEFSAMEEKIDFAVLRKMKIAFIVDVELKDALTGHDFVKHLKSYCESKPNSESFLESVIFFSCSSHEYVQEEYMSLYNGNYLKKSFASHDVTTALYKIVIENTQD